MSITAGMNLEAGATGQDIGDIRKAPLTRRLVMAPVGLIAAEAGAQAGILLEQQLAAMFAQKDKHGKVDDYWRGKVLLGKVVLAVLLYPFSVPIALGLAASGGILHLLLGWPTFGECEDQAKQRAKQLRAVGKAPKGRFTQRAKADGPDDDDTDDDRDDTDETRDAKPAQAEEKDIDLAAKLTDPDVLHTYGRAAELAFERLIQQGHLPPGARPVLNDALVQEVQGLVRDTQKKAA